MARVDVPIFLRKIFRGPSYSPLPLQAVLIVPFVLQIVLAVGVTGYLSFQNGQAAINDLAARLRNEISDRIDQKLDTFLAMPPQINQLNLDAVQLGLLDLNNLDTTGQFFWRQMQLFDVGYINFCDPQGRFVGIERVGRDEFQLYETVDPTARNPDRIYALDPTGKRTKLLEATPLVDSRQESWYKDAVVAGKPVWSQIYQWEDKPEILSISSSFPVYSRDQSFLGVIGVDLLLSGISDYLRSLSISPTGAAFILERNGLLIASSTPEAPYRISQGQAQRLAASQSHNPLIQATAEYLDRKFGHLNQIRDRQQLEFTLNHQRQFILVSPWQDRWGLNWLIVVVVPESDFMAQINANTRNTILLCLLALVVAILVGVRTSRWISQPIRKLSAASQKIASGELDQQVDTARIKELDNLTTIFNQMSRDLRESRLALEEYSRSLEARVQQRTQDLEQQMQEREKVEAQISIALQEKTALLQEVHHRVKNNLQVISSLLRLQGRRTDDPQVQQILAESENRVMAMALVHQNLYQSHNFAQVLLADYIGSLCRHLFAVFTIQPDRIHLDINVASKATVPLDKAVPCGLILNELITNALKHGFQQGNRSGEMAVTLTSTPQDHLTLTVSNNGERLPVDFELEQTQSMGMRLIRVLVEQLSATLTMERLPVTSFSLTFDPTHP